MQLVKSSALGTSLQEFHPTCEYGWLRGIAIAECALLLITVLPTHLQVPSRPPTVTARSRPRSGSTPNASGRDGGGADDGQVSRFTAGWGSLDCEAWRGPLVMHVTAHSMPSDWTRPSACPCPTIPLRARHISFIQTLETYRMTWCARAHTSRTFHSSLTCRTRWAIA